MNHLPFLNRLMYRSGLLLALVGLVVLAGAAVAVRQGRVGADEPAAPVAAKLPATKAAPHANPAVVPAVDTKPAAPAAATTFTATVYYDNLDKPEVSWSSYPEAKQYCLYLKNDPKKNESCFDDDSDKENIKSQFPEANSGDAFIVVALDASGKRLASVETTVSNCPKDVVCAPTEFGVLSSLGEYAAQIMRYALPVGIALSVLMTIYAGILFMLSQGQPDRIKSAQEIIQGAVLGLMILILARFLANYLLVPTNETTTDQQPPTAQVNQP